MFNFVSRASPLEGRRHFRPPPNGKALETKLDYLIMVEYKGLGLYEVVCK